MNLDVYLSMPTLCATPLTLPHPSLCHTPHLAIPLTLPHPSPCHTPHLATPLTLPHPSPCHTPHFATPLCHTHRYKLLLSEIYLHMNDLANGMRVTMETISLSREYHFLGFEVQAKLLFADFQVIHSSYACLCIHVSSICTELME